MRRRQKNEIFKPQKVDIAEVLSREKEKLWHFRLFPHIIISKRRQSWRSHCINCDRESVTMKAIRFIILLVCKTTAQHSSSCNFCRHEKSKHKQNHVFQLPQRAFPLIIYSRGPEKKNVAWNFAAIYKVFILLSHFIRVEREWAKRRVSLWYLFFFFFQCCTTAKRVVE